MSVLPCPRGNDVLYESPLGAVVAGMVRSMIGLGTVMVASDAVLARRGVQGWCT